jgi:hypothetical protein
VTRRIGPIKLIMLTTIGVAAGKDARATDWFSALDANTMAEYATNPQLLPGVDRADEVGIVSLDDVTSAQTERSELSFTPRFMATRYLHETQLDVDTGGAELAYQYKLERGEFNFDGQGVSDSTVTSELGTTGFTKVNRRHNFGNFTAGYEYFSTERLSWQLQGGWQDTKYSDAEQFGLTDYKYSSIGFGPTWKFTARLEGSLTLSTDKLETQLGFVERDRSATAQLKHSLTERYSWHVSGGATRVNVESGAQTASTTTVLEAGGTWQSERVQADISVKRAVLPIGFGLLAREDQAALTVAFAASERSTFNFGFNLIHSDPVTLYLYLAPFISLSYQVYSGASWGQATAEYKYNFSSHWSASAAYQQARARSGDFPLWANGSQARLTVFWQSGRL